MQKEYAMNVHQDVLNEKANDQLPINEYIVSFRKA